jgi:phage terminase large subunit-like protein
MTVFKLTPKQIEAQTLLGGDAEHIMLLGGSRSGKTFLLCRAIAVRMLKAEGSRHLIARFRLAHAKASIWRDTWPKVLSTCFPGLAEASKPNKSDLIYTFPNGSEMWLGGLDDKERVDKVLGNEYATVYLNECSQISYSARETLLTRLAQKTGLRLRELLDCNPPVSTHWTHRLFVEKKRPDPPYSPLPNPEKYAWMRLNPADNADNLPQSYIESLQNLSPRAKQRFWEGQFGSANENALWTYDVIERNRATARPDLQRIVVAIDPSGTSGAEDERSDHVGIVVAGVGTDGKGYVLEDLTIKAAPHVWGRIAVQAYERHDADAVVGETNYGGAMVKHVIRTAAAAAQLDVPYIEVTASRGKVVRAEPVAALYEQNKISHLGTFAELEDQMCAMTTAGYMGDRSPDRADALVWALTELFPGIVRKKVDWEDKFTGSQWAFGESSSGWLKG